MRIAALLLVLAWSGALMAQDSTTTATILTYQNRSFIKLGGGVSSFNLNVVDAQGERQIWRSTATPLFHLGWQRDFRTWYYGFNLEMVQSTSGYASGGVQNEVYLSGIQMGLYAGWSPSSFYHSRGIEFRPRFGGGLGYLLLGNAEKIVNMQSVDLLKSNAIQQGDLAIGLHLGLTMQDHVSGFGFWFELGYRTGLSNLAIAPFQTSRLGGSTVLVGLRYELFRKLGNPG